MERQLGKRVVLAGRQTRWLQACVAALLILATPCAAGMVGPDAVFNTSQLIMKAYNDGDAERIRDALSPEVADLNSLDQIRKTLRACKQLIGDHIERLSLPVSGTRHYGFIEAYLVGRQADMFVEIDDAGRILFWTLSNDLFSGNQVCASAFDRAQVKRR